MATVNFGRRPRGGPVDLVKHALALSPVERAVVAALVSAIVKELRSEAQPTQKPAA
jgi:hypothetical protein